MIAYKPVMYTFSHITHETTCFRAAPSRHTLHIAQLINNACVRQTCKYTNAWWRIGRDEPRRRMDTSLAAAVNTRSTRCSFMVLRSERWVPGLLRKFRHRCPLPSYTSFTFPNTWTLREVRWSEKRQVEGIRGRSETVGRKGGGVDWSSGGKVESSPKREFGRPKFDKRYWQGNVFKFKQ